MRLYEELQRLVDAGASFVLCTVVETSGSTPQKAGSKMVVCNDGSQLGTIGGGAIEQHILQAAKALLAQGEAASRLVETHLTHELAMCCGGRMSVFLERHDSLAEVVLFGAGHVSKEVAAFALRAGFRVCVVDERETWANAKRFPGCQLHLEPGDAWALRTQGHDEAYWCVITHDHALDQRIVETLAGKRSAYLGVIGSLRKGERFRQRMRAAGISETLVSRVECPMGVDIGALTTSEIAVAIVARLVEIRRRTAARRTVRVLERSQGTP
jgi:xanthine dehydrogenase accessory factor